MKREASEHSQATAKIILQGAGFYLKIIIVLGGPKRISLFNETGQ